MKNILFICTGNSARSIMAEAYMNNAGAGRWRAYSAGSQPAGAPNPLALDILSVHDIETDGARSKSWDEFATDDTPVMNVIVTVCDNAAAEVCPVWPTASGSVPLRRLHWSFPDPAAAKGSIAENRASFEAVFIAVKEKIDRFLTTDKGGAA